MGTRGVGEIELKAMNIDQEEAEAVQAYDEAKASTDEPIPFTQAIEEIEVGACDPAGTFGSSR